MAHISRSRSGLWINSFDYTELSFFFGVFVFHTSKHGNIVLEQGVRGIFGMKKEGVAGDEKN
jgi:hypothetical protein